MRSIGKECFRSDLFYITSAAGNCQACKGLQATGQYEDHAAEKSFTIVAVSVPRIAV